MPRLSEAKKDAISRDRPRRGVGYTGDGSTIVESVGKNHRVTHLDRNIEDNARALAKPRRGVPNVLTMPDRVFSELLKTLFNASIQRLE